MLFIPLNSFPASELKKNGQYFFFQQVNESAIAHAEIRQEWLTKTDWPLEQFQSSTAFIYSAPAEIFGADGKLNKPLLHQAIKEMTAAGAKALKLPLGHFQAGHSNVEEMAAFFKQLLPAEAVWLLENDQTVQGGTLAPIQAFLQSCKEKNIEPALTFDTGNWEYTGENAEAAFQVCRPFIRYLHVKHVEKRNGQLITVPVPLGENAFWEQVVTRLPADVPIALEFPLTMEKIPLYKQYIDEKRKVRL